MLPALPLLLATGSVETGKIGEGRESGHTNNITPSHGLSLRYTEQERLCIADAISKATKNGVTRGKDISLNVCQKEYLISIRYVPYILRT